MEARTIFKFGAIVRAKRGSLFEQMLQLIDQSETTLAQKVRRPYVVVSNDLYNYNLRTVMLVPQKTLPAGVSIKNRIFYADSDYILRELVYNQVITVDQNDIESFDGKMVPNSVMEQVSEKICINVRGGNLVEPYMDITNNINTAITTEVAEPVTLVGEEKINTSEDSTIFEPIAIPVNVVSSISKGGRGRAFFKTEEELFKFKEDIATMTVTEICRKYGMSVATFNKYAEKAKKLNDIEFYLVRFNSLTKEEKYKIKAMAKFCIAMKDLDLEHTSLDNVLENLYNTYRVNSLKEANRKYDKYLGMLQKVGLTDRRDVLEAII